MQEITSRVLFRAGMWST